MFVTYSQFYVFLSCLSFGVIIGVLYSIMALIKNFIKKNFIKIILDILYFLLFAILFILYAFYFNFPNFRWYMIFGVLLGNFLYAKSFHIILANFCKRLYNIVNVRIIKGRTNDRRKN